MEYNISVSKKDVRKNRRSRARQVFLLFLIGVLAAGTTWGTIQLLSLAFGHQKAETESTLEIAIDSGSEASETRKKADETKRRKRTVLCSVRDDEAPEISLKGAETKVLILGTEYEDDGASVEDNCDYDVEIVKEGEVDAKVAGTYEIKFKAKDRMGNMSEKKRTVRVVDPASGERVIYLTFDDGPGEHTGRLLDVLAKYGVKATFFVTGYGDDAIIKREFDEGHTVALHTNTHNYAYVYSSVENYFADLYMVRDRVQRITGLAPNLIRFPGGSSNTISAVYARGIMSTLVGEVGRRGFYYADWNISSGDAGGAGTAGAVYANVVGRLGDGQYVVLQHDVKGFSVDAVEGIIQYGLENGYTFLPMNETSFLAHHGVNN